MIIQCPNCAIRFKLDDARASAPSFRLKCSRCGHIFGAPSAKRRLTAAPRKPPSSTHESLTLPFDEPPRKAGDAPGGKREPRSTGAVISPGTGPNAVDEEDERFEITDTEDTYTLGPDSEAAVEYEEEDDDVPPPALAPPKRPAPKRKPVPPVEDDRGKFRAIVLYLSLCVMAYGALTAALLSVPDLADRFVRSLPLVGPVLAGDRLMPRKIALAELSGSYHRIKDGKEVFVISGRAFNTAPVPLHAVQILGQLFDEQGQPVDQRSIYCGNVISTKVLRDLTLRELRFLQDIQPPKQFQIEPGDGAGFVIVFMDPPAAAAEFSAQVVGAQRQA